MDVEDEVVGVVGQAELEGLGLVGGAGGAAQGG